MLFFRKSRSALAKRSSFALFIFTAFLAICSNVLADGGNRNIPGIDLNDATFAVPDNLAEMTTQDIKVLRDTRQDDLESIREVAQSDEVAEQHMFNELMRHDDVRISIADLIPKMIEQYEINGEFKDRLLGYQSTFAVDLVESRENVESLQDYGSYDFRFSAVYMSMLFSFQEHPEFYEKLKADMVDEDSLIGEYRQRLDQSFAQVEEVRTQVEGVKNTAALESLISALDQELARRTN